MHSNGIYRNCCCEFVGGGGVTAIMSEGKVLSKTNVDLSIVTGNLPMAAVKHLLQTAKITTTLDDGRSCYLSHIINFLL